MKATLNHKLFLSLAYAKAHSTQQEDTTIMMVKRTLLLPKWIGEWPLLGYSSITVEEDISYILQLFQKYILPLKQTQGYQRGAWGISGPVATHRCRQRQQHVPDICWHLARMFTVRSICNELWKHTGFRALLGTIYK